MRTIEINLGSASFNNNDLYGILGEMRTFICSSKFLDNYTNHPNHIWMAYMVYKFVGWLNKYEKLRYKTTFFDLQTFTVFCVDDAVVGENEAVCFETQTKIIDISI